MPSIVGDFKGGSLIADVKSQKKVYVGHGNPYHSSDMLLLGPVLQSIFWQ